MKLVIFGCGRIANRIAKSAKLVETIDLAGFASKDIEKAKAYCETYDCRDYGNYDHFLSGDVDAVYIAGYNPGHYDLIRLCLEHQKNVICEKPMLFDVRQTEEVFELAEKNGVLLMEALKSVFLPSIAEVKKMMKEGQIGELKSISASFMRAGHHPQTHWIHDLTTGGVFKDLGSYCIGTMNFLMDGRPKLLKLESDRTAEVSESTAYADLSYGGIPARASVSNSLDGDNHLFVEGDKGSIRVKNYWKEGRIEYRIGQETFVKEVPLISDFYYELKHFAGLCDAGKKMSDVMSDKASLDIIAVTSQIDSTVGGLQRG
ncbi:MAG: Gfo/Idh/MocA family oxidoreductase [Erysipelotrichaceae bacterium]|nr:Gfo/Idh/MocA family oxidoreductase [Erysipelotrichaceae bacterium]